jgi:hypothetical protein
MSLLPLFTRIDQSALAGLIRDSTWLFAAIESVHLLGLALIGGAVLLVDLRLLGLGLRRQSIADVAREAQPWLLAGLAVMLPTGFLMFTSEAVKCYENTAFWVKMASLFLAIVFTFTVRRHVTAAVEDRRPEIWGKAVAVVSLTLWSGVGWGGRWIGFS